MHFFRHEFLPKHYHIQLKILAGRTIYLYSQDEDGIALTHTFLQLSTGIKINIQTELIPES